MPTQINPHPAPGGVPAARDLAITVNGLPLFVHNVVVNVTHGECNHCSTTPVASFDCDGPVAVRIEIGYDVEGLIVRPLRLGIRPQVIGKRVIEFTMPGPEKVSLEFNGRRGRELHLFANALEENPSRPGDPGVTYFGPGIHHAGRIELRNNETIYLAAGALVYGRIEGCGVRNATICGRGILDGHDEYAGFIASGGGFEGLPDSQFNNRIRLKNCRNITVRDILITDSPGWTFRSIACRDMHYENLKLFGGRNNTDGFDLCGCQRVKIHNCFTRVWDDSVVLKSFGDGNLEAIEVTHCQFWNDHAQSLEIGFELDCDHVRDIVFQDIDVLHNYWGGIMTIHNGNQAVIENVLYDDIRIEDCHAWVAEQWIGPSFWLPGNQRGQIRNIRYRNVRVLGNYDPSRVINLAGHDAAHASTDVIFAGLQIQGRPIASASEAFVQDNNFARNIRFVE